MTRIRFAVEMHNPFFLETQFTEISYGLKFPLYNSINQWSKSELMLGSQCGHEWLLVSVKDFLD